MLLGGGLLAALAWARPWASRWPAHQLAWSVLAAIGLHSLLEFPLWYGPFQMAVLLCGVLLWPSGSALKAQASRTLQLAGGLILATVCLAGADYAQARQIYMPAHHRWLVWRDDPLDAAQRSWFFSQSARFAQLSLTRVTPENAPWVMATSLDMLHYSPEPKVVRQLLLSANLLGRQDLVKLHSARWLAAFPTAPLPDGNPARPMEDPPVTGGSRPPSGGPSAWADGITARTSPPH